MIELKHLTKRYGDVNAVEDLCLTLEHGNVYGFLGPNGAGKSTTMNMITGYLGATEGEVLIDGHEINREPALAKKCIGYLPEMPPLYGDMKVGEYLRFAAELKQISRENRKADVRQVMELTKLNEVEDKLIRNLSKGFRQRVGLAQALLGMPEIIILDEPTVGLDPIQIIEIRDLIRSLKDDHTVILSSHIMQEISAVCDHVFIISHGKLVASDTMEHLERTMSGGQRLFITLSGDQEVAEGLQDLPGVVDFELKEIERRISSPVQQPEEPVADTAEAENFAEVQESVAGDTEDTDVTEGSEAEMQESAEIENAADPEAAENTEETAEDTEVPEEIETSESDETVEEPEVPAPAEELVQTELYAELTVQEGMDLRSAVFDYCVETGLVLLGMREEMKSLEDVFLALTSEGEVE